MKSLRRPVVYCGVTYPEYEIDFYTSNVYSLRSNDRILKPIDSGNGGYLKYRFCVGVMEKSISKHKILAETFPDLLSKSPLVSHYDLKIGIRDRHELKTPTGFTFFCNMVCTDHINHDRGNNYHTNLMIVTQHENILKCGPKKGKSSKHKCVYKRHWGTYLVMVSFSNILDENGKSFYTSKHFKTEEEAALRSNTMLEEAMLTIWGPDLGPKMYDFAYKNVIEVPARV